ncbi:(4Fe-4S)-binding protein [Arthrobacter zhaoguopingii]|uniref:(4Fe-4S)-binding protein n=1 Tax=Arthrobacter zhaoguopingii TaxID=2681491 RepID=UPI00135AF736|nr:(4Fe-4S)-binding protein [Arthrobacter zhaoguopingii]
MNPRDGRAPHTGSAYVGDRITVLFETSRCRHVAECLRGLPGVFNVDRRPWIIPSAADPAQVAKVIRRCPSGALQYEGGGALPEESGVPTQVSVKRERLILLRGDLRLTMPDETTTEETRLALCGCGRSQRRLICDAARLHSSELS